MKFIRVLKASEDWKVEKISETDWVIKSPDGTYKNSNGKDYHFKTKEDALEELDYLRAEHKFDKKSSIDKKAKRTIEISMSCYLCFLEERLKYANEMWGGEESVALAPKLMELIEDVGSIGRDNDPDVIADNFVINGEFVNKEEFKQGGEAEGYFEQYNGNWQALCDDALIYDDEYCCLRF